MKANYLLQEKAYETIKEMIKNGELEPGEIYSLNKMASQFEISRTPFRDAVLPSLFVIANLPNIVVANIRA